MNKTRHYIRTLLLMLLFIGGMANEAWAAYTVTYHILTLPMSATQPGNTNPDYYGYRWEALKVTDTNATTVGLPDKYKSPLATNFTYYAAADVTKSGPYNDVYYNSNNKYYLYQISGSPSPLTSGSDITENCDIYVTYDYDEDNAIVKNDVLKTDYTIPYHIVIKDRILSFNIGRNNRLALIPKKYNGDYIVEGEQLCDENFSKISKIDLSIKDIGITTWWTGNKTPKEGAASHFHFRFRLKVKDPYNITICTDYEGDGVYYEKFGKDPNDMKKYYKWSTVFTGSKPIDENLLIASDDHREYTKVHTEEGNPTYNDYKPDHGVGPGYGYYRKNNVQVWNSFSLLNNDNNDGYLFIGTKCIGTDGTIQGGGTDNKFYYLKADNNTLTFNLMTSKDASEKYSVDKKLYELVNCKFHVKTPFGNTISEEKIWTEAYYDMPIQPKHVPDKLRRKYCNFVKFYKDAEMTQEITTFGEANDRTDLPEGKKGKDIYVKYEVTGAPFKALAVGGDYKDATWYELTDAGSTQASGKKLKYDATTFKNNGGNAVYEKESEFAFIGDPYELRVIYRKGTEDAKGNRYVGAATVSAGTNLSVSETAGDGYKWEIPYDETDGSFELRQFRSSETTSMYWQWDTGSAGNDVTINNTITRVKVMELPTFTYVYNIVDFNGTIAIKGTGQQTIFTPLNGYNSIPETIRSPFLSDETITFYDTFTEGNRSSLANERTIAPPTDMADIYVSYTTGHLSEKSINLNTSQQFNVKVNDNYIYYLNDNTILSSPSVDASKDNEYLWKLTGEDPYAIKIYNLKTKNFMKVKDGTWSNDKALVFDTESNASRFIIMSSEYGGEYEIMAATGLLDSDDDGNSDLYHIGRDNAIGSQVKIYSTDRYPHKSDQLRFMLEGQTRITYTLIDKNKEELLTVESHNPRLTLPSEYVSPLVETYYYFPTRALALASLASIHNPNPTGSISEIKDDTEDDNHVWVTYKVKDFGFGSSYPRMLRFLDPYEEGYYLEDGADKLTTEKIQAVYPYCNGDGNLNIYGQHMKDEQISGGSSTRPRWVWFMESENRDPYHVQIHSRSTISSNGSHSTYLQTHAVHFNQDTELPKKQRIITGANFPGLTLEKATEYMILGVTGRYKLLTTNPLAADLDGDGNTTGTGENERRYVTSFEQYWKTYNMVKQEVLGINVKNDPVHKDKFSEDPLTFVVPDEKREELLTLKPDWHSYKAIANAVRWNGYDDKGKGNTKMVENLEHWFQTFDMGDGTFDIEDANIPPFLVLIDRHGWEIMRKPIPVDTDTEEQISDKLAALRAFDSPMVKEYKFYNNATKANSCHKYILRMQNGKERDPITVDDVQFTSTSLAILPPKSAKGVVSGGVIQDHFVTYTVKEEYEQSYTYHLDYTENKDASGTVTSYTINSETGTPSAFVVLQNGMYAKDNASTLVGETDPSSISNTIIEDKDKAEGSKTFQQNTLWYLQPNLDIDNEMGIPWSAKVGNSNEPYQEQESKVKYKDKTGFDPYNLQLVNKSTGRYFTSHMTDSELNGGGYTGGYSGAGGSKSVTLGALNNGFVAESESYDHTHLKITNQTFMAVQDEKGNMQLMPRFDQDNRIDAFATLEAPLQHATTAKVDDGAAMGRQTTFVVPPVVYDYRIIDNDGYPALRYRTGGEFYPSMPEHFKSPLAKDFEFYKGYEKAGDIYKAVESTAKITSSFAAAGIRTDADIFIRYAYNEDDDKENYKILQGRWMTINLNNLDVQATGYITPDGTGVSLYTGIKPATDEDLKTDKKWHWKFLASPVVSTSEYYRAPDPYAVQIFNHQANNDPSYPDGKVVPIKVDGKDRFVLLSHPDGDYALAAGSDSYASYSFLSGDGMTAPEAGSPKAASVVEDALFSTTNSDINDAARLIFNNDIPFSFTYYVITNSSHLAATKEQEQSTVENNGYIPVLPKEIQTKLLNLEDYLYYATAEISSDIYSIDEETELSTLYGLYGDIVYVRYTAYDRENTPYLIPNVRNNASPVAVGSGSNPVSLDINGKLPYNIIWLNDNMMQSTDGNAISDAGDHSHTLSGGTEYIWKFEGNDPYALQIRHKGDGGKYVNSGNTLSDAVGKTYMLLNKEGYEYGVLAETGALDNMLSFDGGTLSTKPAPAQFIIFALSTEKLIYKLLIKPTDETIVIAYREGTEDAPSETQGSKTIKGTTQRDLTRYAINDVVAGAISIGDDLEVPNTFYRPNCAYLYYVEGIYDSYTDETTNAPNTELNNKYKGLEVTKLMSDAGLIGKTVKINVAYGFDTGLKTNAGDGFVRSIDENLWYTFETTGSTPYLTHYTNAWGLQALEGRDTRYTNDYLWTPVGDPFGFVMYNRYMGRNSNAATYVITTAGVPQNGSSIVMAEPPYAIFTTTTESGSSGYDGATAEYKHTAKDEDDMKAQARLFTASGDHYFNINDGESYKKVNVTQVHDPYAKYTTTESNGSAYDEAGNKKEVANLSAMHADARVLTAAGDYYYHITGDNTYKKVTIAEGECHVNATTSKGNTYADYVYELLSDDNTGSFKVCPLSHETLFLDDTSADPSNASLKNVMLKSGSATEWKFGLSEELFEPYYIRAGYVGGLTEAGKAKYEAAAGDLMTLQSIVYDDANLVPYSPGYYRLHNQPGVSGLTTPRYASGYIHQIELDLDGNGNESDAIPMHFFSRKGVSTTFGKDPGLEKGYTESAATRGVIPVPATENDPSTIFFFPKNETLDGNPHSTMMTQGLYVKGSYTDADHGDAVMTATEANATTFSLMDIGGAVFLIHDGTAPGERRYFHFDQSYEKSSVKMIYDLKYYHNAPTDDAKWCLEPANDQGLVLETHTGGDGYYYTTLYAPFDVMLPEDKGGTVSNAFICKVWDTDILHMKKVGKYNTGTYADNDKFVPANTPVIIRTTDNSGKIKLTLPTSAPTTNLSCIFTGKYLEQLLATKITSADKVYTFGLPITGYTIDDDPASANNGLIDHIYDRSQDYTNVGFYVNANPNKELSGIETGQWTPNNRYVLGNKIYYRPSEAPSPSPAPKQTAPLEFIPVCFDDNDEQDEELKPDGTREVIGDGCVYDLMGRKVATREQVEDGSWKQRVATGIYIINGKKIRR